MNYSFDYLSKRGDTIAAISTPLGTGGLGIVRISGKNAVSIGDRIFEGKVLPSQAESHTLTFGKIVGVKTKEKIDEVFLTVMKTPRSYTKEDMVEVTSHGSSFILYKILQQALDGGARLAFPGEFTFRAFLNGRIDLAQAEAVAEVIKAKTDLSLKVALSHLEGSLSEKLNSFRDRLIEILANLEVQIDFPEEDLEPKNKDIILAELKKIENELSFFLSTYDEGKILKDGLRIVIVGKPNVGKSSLLNAFLKEERAIVTPIPGTTRDAISEEADFKGISVRLVDTAGFRVSKDTIELEGIKRTKLEINRADMILWVVDASQKLDQDELDLENQIKDYRHLVVLNKIDLASPENISELEKKLKEKVRKKISALKEQGINELIDTIASLAITIDKGSNGDVILTNLRHKDSLTKAKDAVLKARKSLENNMSFEFLALDLRIALDSIGEIVGKTVTEDILNKIFSDFCIGK
jgi:tRNA modification GTPase